MIVLLFLSLAASAKDAPECEPMENPRVLGRLSYHSVKPAPQVVDGTCSVKISYTGLDGMTKYWMFDQRGKMTYAIDLKGKALPAMLSQNFVFPGDQNPQIKNLNTNPPTLKVTTANGSELFFDIDRGEFLPNSVPKLKYLSNFEIREDIARMASDLGPLSPKERKKYVDRNPNRDLATVDSFSGEYLKYNAKFGDTPDSVRGFGLEIIQNLPNNGKKSCALLADEFMKKDDTPELRRFTQYYTPELIAAVKSAKCEKQSSWTKGVYPPASDSKPLHAK